MELNQRSEESHEHQLLGEGSQSYVYDLGNERVNKVPKSLALAARAVEVWQKQGPEEAQEYASMLEEDRQRANEFVAGLLAAHPEAAWFFGNPRFHKDGTVEQDKVKPLGETLEGLAGAEREAVLDELVGAMKVSWKLGCFEKTFNFAMNYGVNKEGAVMLADFGEMGYSKEQMHQIIDARSWEKSYDASQLSVSMRAKYFGKMQQELTHEALEARWGVGLG